MLYIGGVAVVVQVNDDALATVEVGRGGGGIGGHLFLVGGLSHSGKFVLQVPVAKLHVPLLQQLQLGVQAPELFLSSTEKQIYIYIYKFISRFVVIVNKNM